MKSQKEWFSEQIRKLQNGMYKISFSILKNEYDAEDAVQECIYKAYKNLDKLVDKKKFKSWLYQILVNTCYEFANNKVNHLEIETQEIEDKKDDIDNKMTVWNAVQKLDQPYRTTITLFYYEDLSIKQISEITNIKQDAIKKQLSRGREKIKEVL